MKNNRGGKAAGGGGVKGRRKGTGGRRDSNEMGRHNTSVRGRTANGVGRGCMKSGVGVACVCGPVRQKENFEVGAISS